MSFSKGFEVNFSRLPRYEEATADDGQDADPSKPPVSYSLYLNAMSQKRRHLYSALNAGYVLVYLSCIISIFLQHFKLAVVFYCSGSLLFLASFGVLLGHDLYILPLYLRQKILGIPLASSIVLTLLSTLIPDYPTSIIFTIFFGAVQFVVIAWHTIVFFSK